MRALKSLTVASILLILSLSIARADSPTKVLLLLRYNVPYKSAWFDVVFSTAEAALSVATDQERLKIWNVEGATSPYVYSLYEIPIDTTTRKIAATGSKILPIPRLSIPAVK